MKRATGFTLLELIVVIAIFAVISVMAYGGLSSVLTSRARVAEALDRTAALQKGYLRLRDDFQQLRFCAARDAYGQLQPSLYVRPDNAVEFTRGGWRNPLAQARSSLERIAYKLDDKKQLVRESWRVLDRAPNTELVELPVFEQVEDLKWRFLDASLAWQEHWPATGVSATGAQDPPPRAVELTLHLADLGEVRFLFAATNAVVQPAGPGLPGGPGGPGQPGAPGQPGQPGGGKPPPGGE